jgi:hypothetical protein
MRLRAVVVGMVILLLGSFVLGACGGDDDDSGGSGSGSGSGSGTEVAPEDLRASDAEVAAGLATLKTTVTQTAAAVEAGSKNTAETLDAKIEPTWQPIEGTIKANDPDSYITIEDNFAVMSNAAKDMDADKAKQAADTISSTADAYLEKHPG